MIRARLGRCPARYGREKTRHTSAGPFMARPRRYPRQKERGAVGRRWSSSPILERPRLLRKCSPKRPSSRSVMSILRRERDCQFIVDMGRTGVPESLRDRSEPRPVPSVVGTASIIRAAAVRKRGGVQRALGRWVSPGYCTRKWDCSAEVDNSLAWTSLDETARASRMSLNLNEPADDGSFDEEHVPEWAAPSPEIKFAFFCMF